MVPTFAVTSSPVTPSPRVAARKYSPLRYITEIASPSSFGSAAYWIGPSDRPSRSRTLRSKSSRSASVNPFSSDSIGIACFTWPNPAAAAPETRWVGESKVTSDGLAASIARSSFISRSYSASGTEGSLRT
jgi:hypothetical protein